jgi:hypothetical protein
MKTAIVSQTSLIATLVLVTITATFGLGLVTRKGAIDLSAEVEHFIESLPEVPCRIVTRFRTFPERINPTRSECN